MDFFLTSVEEDARLYKTDIVERTGLSRQSVVDNVDELIHFGIAKNAGNEKRTRYAPAVESETFRMALAFNVELAETCCKSDF